jgi:hypothetical protein
MIKWWCRISCLLPLMMIKNKNNTKRCWKWKKSFVFCLLFMLFFILLLCIFSLSLYPLPRFFSYTKLLLFLPFIYFFLIESLWMVSRRLEMIMTMVNKKRNISFIFTWCETCHPLNRDDFFLSWFKEGWTSIIIIIT